MNIAEVSRTMSQSDSLGIKKKFKKPAYCPLAECSALESYERELKRHKRTEANLRSAIIREEILLRHRDDLIQQKEILSRESDHRLLNGLQLVASLLSIQSRTIKNPEASAQLTIAANRVATIGRVHRHLHALDHIQSVEFKRYLEILCHDLANIAHTENAAKIILVEGMEFRIPTATGIPLGFIVSELITNSIKYANGAITVTLASNATKGYELSVSDDGPGLPEGFDPALTKGLGMKIILSLVKQISGELQIHRGENGKGSRFTVLFS